MKKARLAILTTVLTLIVAACGDDGAGPIFGTTSSTLAPATSTTTTTAPPTTTTTTTTAPTTTTTTTTATTTTTTTTATTTTIPEPEFGFFTDGLGVVDFGASPEEVLAAMEPLLGPPDVNSEWIDEPLCPGPLYRYMVWGDDFDVWLLFTTGDLFVGGGVGHFFSYQYKGATPVPVNPPALTVGTTLSQLQTLYPQVQVVENPFFLNEWDYLVEGDGFEELSGNLSGNGPGDVVLTVRGGIGCGE